MVDSESEFKINEFLTVKNEYGGPQIYIKGKKFDLHLLDSPDIICETLFLMLTHPLPKNAQYSSIDEYIEVMEWHESMSLADRRYRINKDTEYWGCCSNLQAWAEHEYNPNLLRSCIATPLLKCLTHAGDPIALKQYKVVIQAMVQSEYWMSYVNDLEDIKYLDKEEARKLLSQLIQDFFKSPKETDSNLYFFPTYTFLLNLSKETNNNELIQLNYDNFKKLFIIYFNTIEKSIRDPVRSYRFTEFYKAVSDTQILKEYQDEFISLTKEVCRVMISSGLEKTDYFTKYMFVANIFEIFQKHTLFQEFSTEIQQIITKLPPVNRRQDYSFEIFPDVYKRIVDVVKTSSLANEREIKDWLEINKKALKDFF